VASTALFGGSRVPEGGSKAEGKGKLGFAELLAKYQKEGVVKKKGRPGGAISNSLHKGNVQSSSMGNSSITTCYPLGPTSPWSWPYVYYCSPSPYASMWLHPYSQYPASYPYYGALQ